MSPLPPPDHQSDEAIRRSGERKARETKKALPETGSSGGVVHGEGAGVIESLSVLWHNPADQGVRRVTTTGGRRSGKEGRRETRFR